MNALTSPVDIRPDHLEIVQDILCEHLSDNVKVWVFGSRANWTTKDSSDLDLAVEGDTRLDLKTISALEIAFEESDLPYTVDIVDLNRIGDSFRQIVKSQMVPLPLDIDGTEQTANQNASGGWREVPLRKIAEIYDGPHATPQKTVSGPVFLGISNLVNGRIDLSTTEHLSDDDYLTWTRRVKPTPGDIVFSYETRLGEAAAIPDGLKCCLGRRMGLLRPRAESVDSRFLLYAYLGPSFQETLRSRAVQGSTVDRILLSELGTFPIEVPRDAKEQRAIAHVLGTLDDKIELNRRMNETLEAMARALFKSWFVDFEPVRAKMEGRWRRGESLPGLPAEHFDLFPDRLVDSELGEIPEGWAQGALRDAIELLSGGTPKTSVPEYWGGDIPWYTAKDAPGRSDVFAMDTERKVTQLGVENSATRILEALTTVITARGTVGRLACLGVPMAMNQTCYGIRGARGYPEFFTYWNIRTAVEELQTRTHGTIFDTITRETFTLVETALPPTDVASAFEAMAKPVMERILENLKQCRALAQQRDALLPRLVSGEVGARIKGSDERK